MWAKKKWKTTTGIIIIIRRRKKKEEDFLLLFSFTFSISICILTSYSMFWCVATLEFFFVVVALNLITISAQYSCSSCVLISVFLCTSLRSVYMNWIRKSMFAPSFKNCYFWLDCRWKIKLTFAHSPLYLFVMGQLSGMQILYFVVSHLRFVYANEVKKK